MKNEKKAVASGSKKAGKSEAYKKAGVNIDLAVSLLSGLKKKISTTRRPECLAPIGGFGGMFRIDLKRWKKPVMVVSTDGVGTKLMVAQMMGKYESVGHDIVNHCVNDIAVQGAEPAYFVDYIGTGKLQAKMYQEVLTGLADACLEQNMTLIGGETAEMPGMYGDDFDLVGCITGIVEEDKIIDGAKNIKAGQVAIGLTSAGLHTNGFSLARKCLFEQGGLTVKSKPKALGGKTVGDVLLAPHRCYWKAIQACLAAGIHLNGISHITGGGFYDNVPRILPDNVSAVFDTTVIDVPPIFKLIQELGDVDPYEMYRVFNMGIGMVFFVPKKDVAATLKLCKGAGYEALVVGETVKGDRTVTCKL
ncbi:MAG: phosphoribosylformylglycinamidine cyclo-ligase [Victivallales bacterium]|nr:phosphoribosylformylglycinamidine cyclo-ligase [Victivallales bacterium]